LSKYQQNIDSFNCKKYINNVIVTSKFFNIGNKFISSHCLKNQLGDPQDELSWGFKINRLTSMLYLKDINDFENGIWINDKKINNRKEILISKTSVDKCIDYIYKYSVLYKSKLLTLKVNNFVMKQEIKKYYIIDKSDIWSIVSVINDQVREIEDIPKRTLACNTRFPLYQRESSINIEKSINIKRGINIEKSINRIKSIQVIELDRNKYKQLLDLNLINPLPLEIKEEEEMVKELGIKNLIIEGKLWYILNLHLINNGLHSFILESLKRQLRRDLNFIKYNLVDPKLLLFYEEKINNITYQAIFKLLENEWHDIKWVISFKFDTTFLNVHRNILIKNLKENFKQGGLDILVSDLLQNKFVPINKYKSMSRFNISKNDRLSEFLINIFFCILDKKVNDLKYNFIYKRKYLYLKLNNQDNSVVQTPVKINENIFNFKYIRYLDTFIIGINGTKLDVNEIKENLDSFLISQLQLKNVHSFIIDLHNDNLEFMNVSISSGLYYNNKYKIVLSYPKQLIIKALINNNILNGKGIPTVKKNLLSYKLNDIIFTFMNINNFILSSFSHCHDFLSLSKLISFYINCSLKLTLQAKLNNYDRKKVIAPFIPYAEKIKRSQINIFCPLISTRSFILLNKRQNRPILNFMILFKLGLISIEAFKKYYYFKLNNKKYLNRKYFASHLNKNIQFKYNYINWETNVNLDFLILKNNHSLTWNKNKSLFKPIFLIVSYLQ
jgi:Type II intron maturase